MIFNGHNLAHSTYRIRAVDPIEYADVLAKFDRHFKDRLFPVKSDYPSECWIAFYVDTPIGYAALEPSQNYPLTGYLSRCGVLKDHRGHGLQRRFIRVRESGARRRGWQWTITDTIQNQHSANNLIAAGYEIFEPRKPWSVKNATYWRKYIGGDVKSEQPR